MPIHKDLARKLLSDLASDVKSGYELQAGFLKRLSDDDDWSFVIKTQALMEAALTDAVVNAVGDPRVKRLVSRLPIADEENGKLTLALELGLIDKKQRRFVRTMATLRNRLAHRIEDSGFTFESHLSTLTPAQSKSWIDSILWFLHDEKPYPMWHCIANSQPRTAVYAASLMLLSLLQVASVEATAKRRIDAAALETAEELFKDWPSPSTECDA